MKQSRGPGRPTNLWSPEVLVRLNELIAEGLSTVAIAKRLGYDRSCVSSKMFRLGIATKRFCEICRTAPLHAISARYCISCVPAANLAKNARRRAARKRDRAEVAARKAQVRKEKRQAISANVVSLPRPIPKRVPRPLKRISDIPRERWRAMLAKVAAEFSTRPLTFR